MARIEGPWDSVFFGWRVVAVAFVFAVFAWGVAFYGPSVFLHALHQARGWPVSLISAAITAHFLVGAVLVAYLDDARGRNGARRWDGILVARRGAVAALRGSGARPGGGLADERGGASAVGKAALATYPRYRTPRACRAEATYRRPC